MWPFSAASSSAGSASPAHPYYPTTATIGGGYTPNTLSTPTLLAIFATGCTAILGATSLGVPRLAARRGIRLSYADLGTVMWFVLCGFIHTFFEGYFAYNFRAMGSLQDIFGQLWKEYSLSDSRYLTKSAPVLCIEAFTAIFWGPLSFLIAYFVTTDHPLRHPLTILVSSGQLYGTVLYFATAVFDETIYGKAYSRPEPYYFYGYYILMNGFWIVIPATVIFNSFKAWTRTVEALILLDQEVQQSQRAPHQVHYSSPAPSIAYSTGSSQSGKSKKRA
ncbi:hypothetical protein VTJ83DRAFT_5068 [Remersonia thermophila]|uniref:EXPERA domain-containing protein n=1 Tax=Remersonia thermophila TaxID=72144 RepID=A0ABR4DBR7_9PEZI